MNSQSFISFIIKEKANRRLLLLALACMIVFFTVFKLLYPYPDFFSDSYHYIAAANLHMNIGIWPIGYSKFLSAFHFVTHSDTALILFQYFFLECSALYFLFSVLYFYPISPFIRNILFIFLFINPLLLYFSNYVNSDSLFCSLSILWFTQLIWIIHRPKLSQLFVHSLILFACFSVRNNAYVYPLVSILAFILTKSNLTFKILGILAPFLLIVPFIVYTRSAARELTGTSQFSLFTGWQLANNALYVRGHLKIDSNDLPGPEARTIDKNFMKFLLNQDQGEFDDLIFSGAGGNYFIRYQGSALNRYFNKNYPWKTKFEVTQAWGKCSVIFNTYGNWFVRHYPLAYIKYFAIPNAKNYFIPQLEKLEIYNRGSKNVEIEAQEWFDYQTPSVTASSFKGQEKMLFVFPYIFLILNVLYVLAIVWLIIKRKKIHIISNFRKTILVSSFFLLANFLFCISATIIVLRYDVFPMIIVATYSLVLIDLIDRKEARNQLDPLLEMSTIKKQNLRSSYTY
jgi:hypothetical protein